MAEQLLCSVHEKMRSTRSLMDDGLGGKRCSPGSICKVAGTTPTEGREGPGGTCSLHGKNRSGDSLVDDGHGGLCCVAGKECKVSGGAAPVASGKRNICAFWQEGRCTKGSSCTFAHDEHSSDASQSYSIGHTWEEPGRASGWGASGWEEPGWGKAPGGKGLDGKTAGLMGVMAKGLSAIMAKGFGKMDSGKAALMSKAMVAAKGLLSAKGKGKGAPGMGKGKGSSPGQGKGPMASPAPGGSMFCSVHNKPRSASVLIDSGDGNFYCKPGSECKEGGSERGGSNALAPRGPAKGGSSSGPSGTKWMMCTFNEEGKCQKAENCTFAHSEEEIGTPILEALPSSKGSAGKKGGGGARYSPY
ncbi:unnamed protein product [Polarella glacialis]|uniref:C3H1-type domain-containing protein n=1 Tax=Polarella glacialis TaxID=89957 RepID=A0A813DHR4_POLGL|nr:unnamed protein product [Polarella glacialis]CAE8690006.1 unnamed protein product [Polarella glacialis]